MSSQTHTDVGAQEPAEEAPYPNNPKNSPRQFEPIKGTRANLCLIDGSIWEIDHSGHGGESMKTEATDSGYFSFPDLFFRAIADWPGVVDVHQLISYATAPDLYTVSGLWETVEQISDRYRGKPEEVLMVNLHWTFYSTIHSAALFCIEFRPSVLRSHTVKKEFTERLEHAISMPDLGWSAEDISLANTFLNNYK